MNQKIQHYQCRAQNLSLAIDEMHDWIGQQLITLGGNSTITLLIYCSKQYMDLNSYQQLLPEFRQRLLNVNHQEIKFEVIEQGPHKIEMEIKMSKSWLDKTLNNIKEMFSEQDEQKTNYSSPPNQAEQANKVIIKNEQSRYYPIQKGIELACRQLMQTVRSHLVIAPEDVLVLRQIKIHGIDENSQHLLSEFEREFGAAQRSNYINRILQAQHASTSVVLQDVTVEIIQAEENNKPTLDEFECVTDALNRNNALEGVDVQLFGIWELRAVSIPTPAPTIAPEATPVVSPVAESAATILLKIYDGESPNGRELEINQFPFTIGKLPKLDLVLNAKFVSSRHLELNYTHQGLTLTDVGSTNGTWLNDYHDKLAPHNTCVLKAGDSVRLAAKMNEAKDIAAAPRLKVVWIEKNKNDDYGATPVINSGADNLNTPVLLGSLAKLAIKDASGTQYLEINSCPFYIGRGLDQDYIVPQENLNVSGKHLEIIDIQNGYAKVNNLAFTKNGIAHVNSPSELLPAEFNWHFGEEIILAPKDISRAVHITLHQA